MTVWLDQPWMLGLCVVVAAAAVIDLWRPWRAGPTTRWLSTALRVCMLSALVLALARPMVRGAGGAGTVVFVVDCSASMGEEQRAAALEHLRRLRSGLPLGVGSGLVMVGGEAVVHGTPGSGWRQPDELACADAGRTDLGLGTEVALGLVDPGAGGRLVWITDGGDTTGTVSEAVASARALDVPIDVVTVPRRLRDPSIRRLELDQVVVRPGQTVSGVVVVHAGSSTGTGTVQVRLDGTPIADATVELLPGEDHGVRFEHDLDASMEGGSYRLDAELTDVADDADARNNRAVIELVVGPPPRVLAVANHGDELEAMARVLVGERMEVERRTASGLGEVDLGDYDLLIIGDVPAAPEIGGLPDAFMKDVRRWVSSGGGLITLGGDRTYDLGGWGSTPMASVVPLELHPDGRKVEPSVAMVKIMDNSASMGDWSGRHTKMALANEAAAAGAGLLRPRDHLAVVAVNDEVHWVRRLAPMRDPVQAHAAIRSIRPRGGGIYTYTALEAARGALVGADTPLKHVILYADAQDAEEKVKGHPMAWGAGPSAYQLATSMRRAGITLSVIALGDPRDQDVGLPARALAHRRWPLPHHAGAGAAQGAVRAGDAAAHHLRRARRSVPGPRGRGASSAGRHRAAVGAPPARPRRGRCEGARVRRAHRALGAADHGVVAVWARSGRQPVDGSRAALGTSVAGLGVVSEARGAARALGPASTGGANPPRWRWSQGIWARACGWCGAPSMACRLRSVAWRVCSSERTSSAWCHSGPSSPGCGPRTCARSRGVPTSCCSARWTAEMCSATPSSRLRAVSTNPRMPRPWSAWSPRPGAPCVRRPWACRPRGGGLRGASGGCLRSSACSCCQPMRGCDERRGSSDQESTTTAASRAGEMRSRTWLGAICRREPLTRCTRGRQTRTSSRLKVPPSRRRSTMA